ncbi:unnamed protein product [Oncorhynchus mykiss]|nr:unnamed protein product [Oncorhynchus mykiss]
MRRLQLGSSLGGSFGSSMSVDQPGQNSMPAKSMSVDCASLSRKDGPLQPLSTLPPLPSSPAACSAPVSIGVEPHVEPEAVVEVPRPRPSTVTTIHTGTK